MDAFSEDCALAIQVCARLPDGWAPLEQAFRKGPVFLVAEGSSRLLPLGLARSLARCWGGLQVDGSSGRLIPQGIESQLVALSNSGRTRELLEALRDRQYLAICGSRGSPLEQSASAAISVLPRPEKAVASTAAVMGQALLVAESMARARHQEVHRNALLNALREWAEPSPPPCERLWIVGTDDGCAEELALKAWEVAGLGAAAVSAGLVLHGLEEVLAPGDLVWLLHPHPRDLPAMKRRVSSTGAQLLVSNLPQIGALQPLLQLGAGWQTLARLARARGRDPGRTARARKVGNDIDDPEGS